MKKNFLSMVIVFCILCTFIPIIHATETIKSNTSDAPIIEPTASTSANISKSGMCGADGDNLTWILDDEGTLTISGEGEMKRFGSYDPPWRDMSITKIIIEPGVTSIGDDAFTNSTVATVEIADTVTTIYDAFESCYNLESIFIPEGVERIVGHAFMGCWNLRNITLPDSLNYVDGYMCKNTSFYHNEDNWEDGVLYIGNHLIVADDTGKYTLPENYNVRQGTITIAVEAFGWCEDIKSVTLPDTVKYIGSGAFCECSNLQSIVIPDSAERVPGDIVNGTALYNDQENWKDGVLYINNHLIKADSSYGLPSDYKVREGTVSISNEAFQGSNLQSVIIPDSVHSIEYGAFEDSSELTNVILPNGITKIEDRVFSNCGMENIILPESLIEIGSGAFAECAQLTEVIMQNNVKKIGNGAFGYCSIAEIYLSNTLEYISEMAFSSCRELKTVTIPDTVIYIGAGAFRDCGYLNIYVSDNNENYCDIEGVLFNKNKTELIAYGNGRVEKDYAIPKGVNKVEDFAFYEARKLTGIIIPEGVTSIGEAAFEGARNLIDLVIPEGVISIGQFAFQGCYKLTNVSIPSSVTDIGQNVFVNCNELVNVAIKDGAKIIGQGEFQGCSNIQYITLPDSLTYIGNWAFINSSSLKEIVIPLGVTSINEGTFCQCYDMKRVFIHEKVINIGDSAFESCDDLSDVYYEGTEEQWHNILISENNTSLLNASIHYSSAMPPRVEPITTPTVIPSSTPSVVSTATPTASPTVKPTATPTNEPTATPTVEPTNNTAVFIITDTQLYDNAIEFTVTNNSDTENSGTIMIAAYNPNGSLLSIQTRATRNIASKVSKSCEADIPKAAYYKLFIWDSFKSMNPLSENIEIR